MNPTSSLAGDLFWSCLSQCFYLSKNKDYAACLCFNASVLQEKLVRMSNWPLSVCALTE
jgi:hypothetical protein